MMPHKISDDMTTIYTTTRVPPAKTPDKTVSTQIGDESKSFSRSPSKHRRTSVRLPTKARAAFRT